MKVFTLFDCTRDWGSVRKVRYLADIYSSVEYGLENAEKAFSEDAFRKCIFRGRQHRLELIHKHYQRVFYTPMGSASLETKRLQITLSDTLTFLKNIGIFEVKNGKIHPGSLAFQLRQISNRNEGTQALIEAILKSKYPAYWCFLKTLSERKSIRIPRGYIRRDENLRRWLSEQGFFTDVASFFTLRDIFYELRAINWYIDPEDQESIYSACQFADGEVNQSEWQYSFSVGSRRIFCGRKISMDSFIKGLISSYLKLTGDRFDVEANLLSLRDDVCKFFIISDQQFSELLLDAQKMHETPVIIKLSFGSLYDNKRNYGLKITTLPEVSPSRLAMYIRLKGRD